MKDASDILPNNNNIDKLKIYLVEDEEKHNISYSYDSSTNIIILNSIERAEEEPESFDSLTDSTEIDLLFEFEGAESVLIENVSKLPNNNTKFINSLNRISKKEIIYFFNGESDYLNIYDDNHIQKIVEDFEIEIPSDQEDTYVSATPSLSTSYNKIINMNYIFNKTSFRGNH